MTKTLFDFFRLSLSSIGTNIVTDVERFEFEYVEAHYFFIYEPEKSCE